MQTKIKLLDKKAVIPKRAHETDTGYDLTFIGIEKIEGDVIFFKTGISVIPPESYYWEIAPCSRISKYGLSVANSFAVIDEGYRGELLVAIRVHHSYMGDGIGKSEQFAQGIMEFEGVRCNNLGVLADRILKLKPVLTQMILRKRFDSEFVILDKLDETARGEGGFGSTEKKIPKSAIKRVSQ